MKPLFYLMKRELVNRLRMAVHKPTTLLIMIFGIAYGIFIIVALGGLMISLRINSVRGLVIIMTLLSIYMGFGNFMAYSSRKGIIFRPAHSQFVFTAPLNPKLVLLNSAWMNYVFSAVIWVILCIAGFFVFGLPLWKAFLFFAVGFILETVLETSLMILLYTGERITEKAKKTLGTIIKVFLIVFTLAMILYFRENGVSAESANAFIDWPFLQILPVIGWQISFFRLLLLGPDILNVICSSLYLIACFVLACAAARMRCDGGYYEEAARFADDYADVKNRQKNGDSMASLNNRRKAYRKVGEQIRGKGAKAIFYRQLSEYKKEKYFIFSKMTISSFAISVIFCFCFKGAIAENGRAELFLLGIVAYISLIMNGYMGKWELELKNPYLFLIPDTAGKKLWYATLMEHIKAFVDASLLCIPFSIFWGIRLQYVIFCILIAVVLQANRLYMRVVAQCIVGDVFGKKGIDMVRMAIQLFLLSAGAGLAVVTGLLINMDFIFPILLFYSMIVTVVAGLIASLRFETMEQLV